MKNQLNFLFTLKKVYVYDMYVYVFYLQQSHITSDLQILLNFGFFFES